jgi:hypothetical protein
MKSLKQLLDDRKQELKTSPLSDGKQADPLLNSGEGRTAVNTHISREYQDYGYRLAMELSDEKHKSLYIKLAKTVDRAILEKCRSFVIDSNANNKGALFMWKMKELKNNKSNR